MSLSSAKAKLDAQGGDPATGYISKQDHKDSYDQLVADTALTGATTAEAVAVTGTTDASSSTTGTLKTAGGLGVAKKAYVGTDLAVGGAVTVGTTVNGRDPDDLIAGPASATDNALVRFDGTGGKTAQDSGITVDDSGNVTSDLTVSKATARLISNATSGTSYIEARGASATWRGLRFCTGSTVRFGLYISDETESGSNAGSNFGYYRAADGGGETLNVLVTRSTGKWSFRDVGATAGLELGASGPRVMSGTGSPEGVVTAPVGSTWIATPPPTTGAIQWIKATGTGNTGWVVQHGDTGRRDIASLANSIGTLTLSSLVLRRIGSLVSLEVSWADSQTNPNSVALVTLPAEFRPSGAHYFTTPYDSSSSTAVRNLRVSAVSGTVYYGGATDASGFVANMTWATSSTAWPSSLPGSAA